MQHLPHSFLPRISQPREDHMLNRNRIPEIHRLRLPPRYSIDHAASGLSVRQLGSAEREVNVTIEPYRTRGDNCRRLLARADSGENFVIEFASFCETYPPEITGTIRGRAPSIDDELLVVEGAQFRDEAVGLAAARAERDNVHDAWAAGINYRREIFDANGGADSFWVESATGRRATRDCRTLDSQRPDSADRHAHRHGQDRSDDR